MSTSPVRVTGIEAFEDGADIVVTLTTPAGPSVPYAFDEEMAPGLEGILGGLRSEPDDLLSRAARGVVEREEHRSDFETFGVGEAA